MMGVKQKERNTVDDVIHGSDRGKVEGVPAAVSKAENLPAGQDKERGPQSKVNMMSHW